jgi:hypothetical protein
LQIFLSIVADTGDNLGWVVENIPLFGPDIVGEGEQEVSTLVDLGLIGVNRGDNVEGTPFTYAIVLSKEPLEEMPGVTLAEAGVIGGRTYDFGGLDGGGGGEVPKLEPADKRPQKPPFDGGSTKKWVWRNLENNDVGYNQCTPASMAMSFYWLAQQYPNDVGTLGGQSWYKILEKFKSLRVAGPRFPDLHDWWENHRGVRVDEIVPAKLKFLQLPDKGFPSGWQVKYQGKWTPIIQIPAQYQVGGMIAHRIGPDAPATFNFVLTELQAGEDVEIHVGWYQQDGTRDGGHSLGVRGALQHGNKMYIWTTDDAKQNAPSACANTGEECKTNDDCEPGDVCVANKPDGEGVPGNGLGLRNAHISQVLMHPDGYMELSGLKAHNKVDLVTSESPPPATVKKRKATFRPVEGKGYVIESYIYTNDSLPRRQQEALTGPIKVSDQTVVLRTKLNFNPSDIHIKYRFQNRPLTQVIHNIWKAETKGGKFTWKFRKPPDEVFPRYRVCEELDTGGFRVGSQCCTDDAGLFGCQDGEPCTTIPCPPGMDPEAEDDEEAEGACDTGAPMPYNTCPDPAGTPPYDIDCRVWACDGDDMCVEIPSEGLSPDGTFNLYGDVNDDGSVTPTDISCLQRWAAGTVVPPFTGCDKGGPGNPVVPFEYIDFASCRHANNPNGRGDGALTPTEISYVQFVGASNAAPIGDCYYCGGNP